MRVSEYWKHGWHPVMYLAGFFFLAFLTAAVIVFSKYLFLLLYGPFPDNNVITVLQIFAIFLSIIVMIPVLVSMKRYRRYTKEIFQKKDDSTFADILMMAFWIMGIGILSIFLRVVLEKFLGMTYDYQAAHPFVSLNISTISLVFMMAYFKSRVDADRNPESSLSN